MRSTVLPSGDVVELGPSILRVGARPPAHRNFKGDIAVVNDARSKFPRLQAAVVGIGCTEFSRNSGVSVFTLAARAVKAAVADAGLKVADIDGLATFGTNDSIAPNVLAPALGVKSLNFYVDQWYGGSVSLSMLGQAALAVSAGVAECVVCYRAINGRSENRLHLGLHERPVVLMANGHSADMVVGLPFHYYLGGEYFSCNLRRVRASFQNSSVRRLWGAA